MTPPCAVRLLAVVTMPASALRVALIIAGKFGRFEGKLGDGEKSDDGILNVSSYCWSRNLLDKHAAGQTVELFAHAWELENTALAEMTFRPTRAIFEKQIEFRRPIYGLSRIISLWSSRMRALQLAVDYERETGERFDLVHVTRWDMCICRDSLDAVRYRALPAGKRASMMPMSSCSFRGNDHYPPANKSALPPHHCGVPGKNALERLKSGDVVHGGLPFAVPRFDDTKFFFRNVADALRFSSAMVHNSWNQTDNIGGADPHGLLGVQLMRTFHWSEVAHSMPPPWDDPAVEHAFTRNMWRGAGRGQFESCSKPWNTKAFGAGTDGMQCYARRCTPSVLSQKKSGLALRSYARQVGTLLQQLWG